MVLIHFFHFFCLPTPEDYTLHVQVSNQHDNIDAFMKIHVRPRLTSLLISPSTPVPLVMQTFHLEASTEPSTFGVWYTWDFGDDMSAVHGTHEKVSHGFKSAGVYNITVCANNTLTSLTAWLMVVVMEEISGLTVTYNGPTEVGLAADLVARVATGTGLMWDFDFGDGSLLKNLTDGAISHIYESPGSYKVDIMVSNSVSQAHEAITIEVYRLTVSGVLPAECIINGKDTQFTALVNGNILNLTFHWLFGDGSSLAVVKGQPTAMHSFLHHGIFHVNLTVFSSVTSVSLSARVCVESTIVDVEVRPSQGVVAVDEEMCIKVFVSPEQVSGYEFKWSSSPSGVSATSQQCFVFREEGVKEVSVVAANKVSNRTAKAYITVQKPVGHLQVSHHSHSDTLTVNTLASFWVASCVGSNVSVLWDFGDGSPVEQKQNASHVFLSAGRFTVTATAFNAISRDSTSLTVNVLLPVSDLSLHTDQPNAAVGEETLITAVSSTISSTNYYWTVEGLTTTKQGTYQFRFIFPKPGVYQVKVIAQNLVSRREAAILIDAYERINNLQIEWLKNERYVRTHEKLLFIGSVSKGSNITYHWLLTESGAHQQIEGDGELFHVLVKTPGDISVQLRASNVLGNATSSVSLVAVESVTSAHIEAQSNILALGKLVNISVFVDAGSDLRYSWYVDTDITPLQTHVPFLLHVFTSLGPCFVRVSVQNVVSQSEDTKLFLVQEEVKDVDFKINTSKHPFYINASAALSFHGFVHRGSDLHWDWNIQTAKENLYTSTNQSFIYTFPCTDIYWVFLNVSNGFSWQTISHSVTVQDPIEGLHLNLSKSCTEDHVSFIPTFSKGSNVSFVITFKNKDFIQNEDFVKGDFITANLPAGRHTVTVKAWNQVSSAETSESILVTERVQGLQLVNCCSMTLEAQKGIHFKAEVQSGFPVNYTWMFKSVGSGPMWLTGQEVIFMPPESGLLFVSVLASNGVCSQTVHETARVEWPVQNIKLLCHSERIFVGHAVKFSATANEGSRVRYLWVFGDSAEEFVTDLNAVNHTYYHAGKYSVAVKVVNNVSQVSVQLLIVVEELQCSRPQASLIQSQFFVFRSRPSFFEASVDTKCSAYKTTYLWEIFRDSCCNSSSTDVSVLLRSQEDAASPLLLLPKHTLDVGSYCLVFTVSLHGTPLFIQLKANVTVVHSPLVAVIKGGSHRLWPSLRDLVLDGSESHDPDVEPEAEDILQYHWAYRTEVKG